MSPSFFLKSNLKSRQSSTAALGRPSDLPRARVGPFLFCLFVCLFVCLVFHFIGILRRRAAFFTALISRLGAGWPGQATADLFKVRHSMAAHKKNAHEEARPALTHTHTQRERERERDTWGAVKDFRSIAGADGGVGVVPEGGA